MRLPSTECAYDIHVYGLVQGVGFRPFLCRLATRLHLTGWAVNRNDCVHIRVQGASTRLEEFMATLQRQPPPLARIERLAQREVHCEPFPEFRIVASQNTSDAITGVSPDMAVCQDCLNDLHTQPKRLNYPFVNCTNCGPRFSIIRDLPYDRAHTTMQSFPLCPSCRQEYDDLTNRRFHAQPNACRECGPEYELFYQGQRITGTETILDVVRRLLETGQIVAIKGIGGFHLACDATNEQAAAELRRRKQREDKPLAVMFGSLEQAREYADISDREAEILVSGRRPIVLVMLKNHEEQNVIVTVNNLTPCPSPRGERCSLTGMGCSLSVSPKATDSPPGRGKGWVLESDPTTDLVTHPQPLPGGEFTAAPCKNPYLSERCSPSLDRGQGVRWERNTIGGYLAPSVTRGLATLGLMLPYTPFHHLLFERLTIPAIVLTSGNLADEPIVISNHEAETRLTQVADAVLTYNRDIHNRSDDSVAMVVNDTVRLLRRSRGWTPEPIMVKQDVEGIVAAGAELKNCFCVGKGRQAILSQHIGDLKNLETYKFYQEAFERFQRLFRVTPELIACDQHPDYLSTRFAVASGLPLVKVQHHHAHIAACMAEYDLDEPVLGVSFDGTGLGDDGQSWGGEFLICDLAGYQRFSHIAYTPMPGGDKAIEEPWRMGLAYLYKIFGRDFLAWDLPFLRGLEQRKIELLLAAIDQKINCPLTSSVGRLFDAVAAIMNLVTLSSFEAEAPMRLESLLVEEQPSLSNLSHYGFTVETIVNVEELISGVVHDVSRHVPADLIARKFHNTLIAIMADLTERMRVVAGLNTVVLSGGVFQNRYLLRRAEERLTENGFTVYSPARVPANDGGICLGQLAVAAKWRAAA